MTLDKSSITNDKVFYGIRYHETLTDNGLGERYFNRLDTFPEKIIQVDAVTGVTETSSSVKERACQIATELFEIQTKPTDIVATCCVPRLDEAVVVLGTLFAGAQLAILDPDMTKIEFTRKIDALKPKVLFCDPRIVSHLETEHIPCQLYVYGKNIKKNSIKTLFFKKIPEDFVPVAIENPERKTAFIILTDGTTGSPKIVRISHSAAFVRITKLLNCLIKDIKKVVSYFPLMGTAQVMLTCCSFENYIVRIVPSAFSEREACRIIHDLKVDAAILGTQHTKALADYNSSGQDFNIDCLKRILIGGTVTTAMTMVNFKNAFPDLQILNLYSVVECGLIAGLTPDDLDIIRVNPATLGTVFPGGKVKIVDFITQKCLGNASWGELWYSGPDLASSYFDDLEFLEKGYFSTGDIAKIDKQGYLYIYGRLDDKFDIADNSFFAIDLESILSTHPKVKDCVVTKNSGQLVVYVIAPNTATKDLLKWLEKKVPPFMLPTMIYVVNDIPRTNNGKAKKYLMAKIVSRRSILDSISD